MKYIVLDKFTNSLVTNEEGLVIEFSLEEAAILEASECQDGLVIPINTDRLFTKAQVLDILVAFDQSVNPENFSSSEELCPEDFADAALCKAQELKLEEEFNKAIETYSKASEHFLNNYTPESLL